ncbi:hypothetical protein ACFW04_000420 [Cataglyphis niger]
MIDNMDPLFISEIFCIKNRIIIGAQTDLDEKIQNCINIGDLILKSFRSNPNFIGQVDGETGEKNTFQDMREKTVKCALWMQSLGVKPNDVVMICTNNQLDAYVPFLATLYIGAVVSPLDHLFNLDMIDFFIEKVRPVMLFINEIFYRRVHDIINHVQIFKNQSQHPIPTIIIFHNKKKNVQTNEYTTNEDLLTLDDILNHYYHPFSIEYFSCAKVTHMKSTAMRLFTPGTTSFPVQIYIPHLAFMAPSNQHAPDMRKNDTALLLESLCYINSIFMTIQAILLQVKVIRIKKLFFPKIVCQIIEKYKVTWVYFESNMCYRLIKCYQNLSKYNISSLRTIVFSGSTVNSIDLTLSFSLLLPNVSILQAYSLTETGIIAYQRQPGKVGSSGFVSADVQLKIISLHGPDQSLGPYEYGQVCCISPYMLTSYLKYNSEQPEDWFKTGDTGCYDLDGDIFIDDKINQHVHIGNFQVSPTSPVANLLQVHRAVLEATVIPVPIPNNMQCFVAIIVKLPGAEVTEMEIKRFLTETCNCRFNLGRVIFTQIYPCHSNGKINIRFLSNMARSKYWDLHNV